MKKIVAIALVTTFALVFPTPVGEQHVSDNKKVEVSIQPECCCAVGTIKRHLLPKKPLKFIHKINKKLGVTSLV